MTAQLRLVGSTEEAGEPLLGGVVRYVDNGADAVTDLVTESLLAHGHRFGPRPHTDGADGSALIEDLAAVALTGRGGGHFPVAAKWRAVLAAEPHEDGAVVVANGAEGEPLSGKDAALLELRPHLVLDGLACAAEAVGAGHAVLWVHENAHAVRAAVNRALAERAAARLDEPQMRVALGPDRYLTGESSAVVRALSGGPALPMFRLMPHAVGGVHGRPTLVQNVESLARVALVARGHDATASTLLSVAAPGHRVVIEVPSSTRLRHVVESALGHTGLQAILIGGYGGRWARWSDVRDVAACEPDLRALGRSLGAGVLLPLAATSCGLDRAAEIAGYLADSSARQCGPCLFGLRAIANVMADLAAADPRRRDRARLDRFLLEVSGRGGCHHPDGAVAMVSSALETFAEDVAAHRKGRCMHVPPRRSWLRRG